MGTSTNAILFYGYCWTEETSRPWQIGDGTADDKEDWEDRYARTNGCLPPILPFPDRRVTPTRENDWNSTPKDYSDVEQAIIDRYRAYGVKKGKIVDEAVCCVATHCSCESPMPYVAIKASQRLSRRGCMNEITSLAVDPGWDDALAFFCETMGIKTDGKKAAWWLVSNWC